jgi:two-component sensor histidine kinase
MLSELISNSYKCAMNKVENPAVEVPITKQGGGEYLLFYSDNGPGLPADFPSFWSTLNLGAVKILPQTVVNLQRYN